MHGGGRFRRLAEFHLIALHSKPLDHRVLDGLKTLKKRTYLILVTLNQEHRIPMLFVYMRGDRMINLEADGFRSVEHEARGQEIVLTDIR